MRSAEVRLTNVRPNVMVLGTSRVYLAMCSSLPRPSCRPRASRTSGATDPIAAMLAVAASAARVPSLVVSGGTRPLHDAQTDKSARLAARLRSHRTIPSQPKAQAAGRIGHDEKHG